MMQRILKSLTVVMLMGVMVSARAPLPSELLEV